MRDLIILLVSIAFAALLAWPKLSRAILWRATITPLASIIGSGFLVLGPILGAAFGSWAPAVMAALCAMAYLFGNSIRFNIAAIEREGGSRNATELLLELAASWTLAFAYIISVAYYLNLFGSFGVNLTPWNDPLHAKLLTSAMFALILAAGWLRGFKALEGMEQWSVGLKLAIIGGLLFGLGWYVLDLPRAEAVVNNHAQQTGWQAIAMVFGLIVTVQGFETSRYLGETYSAKTRIRSMRLAQGVSTIIYMIYIGFLSHAFPAKEIVASETEIIELMRVVAPILPVLLVVGALSAQFSAAVADTSGSGGLIAELTHGRVSHRQGYALLVLAGLGLTWSANVFQIISYASRAFAAYYALQAAVASVTASRRRSTRWRVMPYAALAALGAVIAVFGAPVE